MHELQLSWKRLPQTMMMAALVATLLCFPVGALFAFLSYAVLGTSVQEFVTFGGATTVFAGLLAWWALAFLAALIYAAFGMPDVAES